MSGSKLDQIVKGAPPPGTSLPNIVSRSSSPSPALGNADLSPSRPGTPLPPSDPLATLPSSPPQIYLNLLILEASLRSQYLTLRARRRQHTFFLLVLTGWITCFFYALFLRPREDGSGMGGSVYWVVEMAEKLALMGGGHRSMGPRSEMASSLGWRCQSGFEKRQCQDSRYQRILVERSLKPAVLSSPLYVVLLFQRIFSSLSGSRSRGKR